MNHRCQGCWLAIVLLAVWIGLTGCTAPAPALVPVDPAVAAEFAGIVSDLADPAMDGRGAGDPGLDEARDYVVDQFQRAGLEPAFVHDGQVRRFTQPIDISLGVRAAVQSLGVRIDGGKGADDLLLLAGRLKDFNALGFSADGAFAGGAVFVGYAIVDAERGYDSFSRGDSGLEADLLKGRVAIAYRYEPLDADGHSQWAGAAEPGRWTESAALLSKAQRVAERGGAALVVVDPPSMDAGGPLRTPSDTGFIEPAPIPVFHLRGSAFARLLRRAGRDPTSAMRVYEQRANLGIGGVDILAPVELRGEVRLERPQTTIHNVGGVLPGAGGLAEQVVIVGAHYDHLGHGEVGSFSDQTEIHPGADDNASGTAAVILLARRMSRLGVAPPESDRRSILFVSFSGEERGLLGSGYLAKHPAELAVDLDQGVAMVNFDMVGRLRNRRLFVFGTATGDGWSRILDQANSGLGFDLQHNESGIGPSDHTSFYLREIPALHLFTGVHEDYHRPSDTPDKINAAGGGAVVDLAARVLDRLTTEPVPMIFQAVDAGPGGGLVHAGRGAYLGIMPDYATLDGDSGCGVSRVSPGSPAAAAGLLDGDLIVRWNGEPVRGVRGLSALLTDTVPGENLELIVERGGRTLRIEVVLGRR